MTHNGVASSRPNESADKLIADLAYKTPEIDGYPWRELLRAPWEDIVRLEHQLRFDITGIQREITEEGSGKSLAWRSAANGALRIKQNQVAGVRALRRMRQEEAFAEKARVLAAKEDDRQLRHIVRMMRAWLVTSHEGDRQLIEDEIVVAIDRIHDDRPIDAEALIDKIRERRNVSTGAESMSP